MTSTCTYSNNQNSQQLITSRSKGKVVFIIVMNYLLLLFFFQSFSKRQVNNVGKFRFYKWMRMRRKLVICHAKASKLHAIGNGSAWQAHSDMSVPFLFGVRAVQIFQCHISRKRHLFQKLLVFGKLYLKYRFLAKPVDFWFEGFVQDD